MGVTVACGLAVLSLASPVASAGRGVPVAARKSAPPSLVDPAPTQAPGTATIREHTGGTVRLVPASRLPPARRRPRPLPPRLAAMPVLGPHQVFAFAPWWTLGGSSSFDVSGLSTIAYFGVSVKADGTIATGDTGWQGLHSAQLVALVDRAHAAGDRVVLTAECLDPTTLDQLVSHPSVASRLALALARLVAAESLDGVNFDFEGTGTSGRAGLVKLIRELSSRLRAIDPHWQVTMDTYGGSAAESAGFFDIPALAPYVDAFFVMAYDMGSRALPSPNAPLGGPGWTDTDVVRSYTQVVAPSKVILGIPFYGYEWATAGPGLGSRPLSAATPASYAQLAGRQAYWDRAASVPWTTWRQGSTWHQAFFDDPASVYLKAALAYRARLAGVGVWALGMEGDSPAMMEALLGRAPVLKGWIAYPEPPLARPAPSARPAGRGASSRPRLALLDPRTGPTGAGTLPTTATTSTTPATTGAPTASTATTAPRARPISRQAPSRHRSGSRSTPTTTTPTTTTTTTPTTTTTTTPTTTTTTTTPTTTQPASPSPSLALCELLEGDQHLAGVLGSLAGGSKRDAPGEVAAMARAVGCAGGQARPPAPAGLCHLLAAQTRLAASLQEAARLEGRRVGADLARLVQGLADHEGCAAPARRAGPSSTAGTGSGSTGSAAPGTCRALTSFLNDTAWLGRTLGLDLRNLPTLVPAGPCSPVVPPPSTTTTTPGTTTTTATTSSTTTISPPTTAVPGSGMGSAGLACLELAKLAGGQLGLQRAAATVLHHGFSEELGGVVMDLARQAGCPPA
jgi:hypothetical protein